MSFLWFVRASYAYYQCVNTIDCTGKTVPTDLLIALGEADANMYLCSKDIRPGENRMFSFFLYDETVKSISDVRALM